MRKIEDAANEFLLETKKKSGDTIAFPDDLTPYIKLNSSGSIPSCPASGTYNVDNTGPKPDITCSLGSTVNPPHLIP
jgi:hypothetical protein